MNQQLLLKKTCLYFNFIFLFSTSNLVSQDLEKEIIKNWWNIKEICFAGYDINKNNSRFMSTANVESVGTIYKLSRGFLGFGKLKGFANPAFFANTVNRNLTCLPIASYNSAIESPGCKFSLDASAKYQLEITGNLIDKSKIGEINAELLSKIKSIKTLVLNIQSWGIEQMETGVIESCLRNNNSKPFVKSLRNGKHYIVLAAIWVKGIKIDYHLDRALLLQIKALYDSKKEDFINAGITFDFNSETTLSTEFEYQQKFYPFIKVGKITKEGEIEGMLDVIVIEPDLREINNY